MNLCVFAYMITLKLFLVCVVAMKELSPSSISVKKVHKETLATEPILIIISPGADPSQELQEMAQEVIGIDKYHQVIILCWLYIENNRVYRNTLLNIILK